jgi:hypothetical protein
VDEAHLDVADLDLFQRVLDRFPAPLPGGLQDPG